MHVGGEAKQWAKAQFEATLAETRELAKTRRDAIEKAVSDPLGIVPCRLQRTRNRVAHDA